VTGKQRARERAAREAAAAGQRPAPSAGQRPARDPAGARSTSRRPARQPVYRLRRFPPLPWRLKAALALGWLAVAAAVLYLVPTWAGRFGLLVLATAALPLVVVLVRDPSRRTR
jgi:hypothetical protein